MASRAALHLSRVGNHGSGLVPRCDSALPSSGLSFSVSVAPDQRYRESRPGILLGRLDKSGVGLVFHRHDAADSRSRRQSRSVDLQATTMSESEVLTQTVDIIILELGRCYNAARGAELVRQ